MANPRTTPDFEDIGIQTATYISDNSTITYSATATNGSASVGLAVKLSADRTVALTQDGDAIEGKLLKVEADNRCTVQVGGFCTLPGGDGATLTRGQKIVGALGAASARGYIRQVATGTAAELGKARGRTIDNSVTTAVVVCLD